eukprot:2930583-Amphidinium_carterae.1
MEAVHLCQEEWYRDLEDMVADGSPDVQDSAQQDWEKHHRSRKDKSTRQNGVLHVDLADMGEGHSNKRYVLVMAATMTIDGKQ